MNLIKTVLISLYTSNNAHQMLQSRHPNKMQRILNSHIRIITTMRHDIIEGFGYFILANTTVRAFFQHNLSLS